MARSTPAQYPRGATSSRSRLTPSRLAPVREVTYIAQGAGPPALLIHGLGGFKEAWGAVPSALEDAVMRALAVDLPGSGAARRPRGYPGTSAAHARTLAALLDQTGPSPSSPLAGLCGGPALAARRPALVTSLTLIAPVVVPRPVRNPAPAAHRTYWVCRWWATPWGRSRSPGRVATPTAAARRLSGRWANPRAGRRRAEDRLLSEAADRLGRADVGLCRDGRPRAARGGHGRTGRDPGAAAGDRRATRPPGAARGCRSHRARPTRRACDGAGRCRPLPASGGARPGAAAIAAHARRGGGASSRGDPRPGRPHDRVARVRPRPRGRRTCCARASAAPPAGSPPRRAAPTW